MVLMLLWLLSSMLFPVGASELQMYIPVIQKLIWVLSHEWCMIGGPHSWKIDSNWLEESCWHNLCPIVNWERPLSMSIRKCLLPLWVMSITNLLSHSHLSFLPIPIYLAPVNWQPSASLTTDFMTSVNTKGSTNLTKYRVLFTLGWSVCWGILATWLLSNSVFLVPHTNFTGLISSLYSFNHLYNTLVKGSALFRLDLTSVMCIIKPYLSTSPWSVSNHRLTNISTGAFVLMHTLPNRMFEIQ